MNQNEDFVTRTFLDVDELISASGQHLGFSSWHEITQDKINTFAQATGDKQWIHVDPDQASDGPFGSTIAHGYLTLSLISSLVWEIYTVSDLTMTINYGLNKVRFPAPTPVGSFVRAGVELAEVTQTERGVQVLSNVVIERKDYEKPVCIAQTVTLLIP